MPTADETLLYGGFPAPLGAAATGPAAEAHAGPTAATTADFEAMKRSFEAATLNGTASGSKGTAVNGAGDAKQRVPSNGQAGGATSQHSQAYPSLQATSPLLGGYGDVYAAAGAGSFGQLNGNPAGLYGVGVGAPPFVPAAQQQQSGLGPLASAAQGQQDTGEPTEGSYSHPATPYEGSPNPDAIPFGSPSSQNGALPQQQGAFPTSTYDFDPTMSMPTSPNPYANPYAPAYGGLGFGNTAFLGGMMSPLLSMGMASPQMGGLDMQQNYAMQYGMMGSPDFGMSAGAQTVSLISRALGAVYLRSLTRALDCRAALSTSATFHQMPRSTSC